MDGVPKPACFRAFPFLCGAVPFFGTVSDCPVYLTRHGESVMNQTKSMGGDARLSPTGDRYAGILAGFISAQPDAGQSRLSVWCSPMNRAAQTARAVSRRGGGRGRERKGREGKGHWGGEKGRGGGGKRAFVK